MGKCRIILKVVSRTRISTAATCPMDLALFPMDRQVCSLIFQSSAHPNNEVRYKWKNNTHLEFVQGIDYQDRMMPGLRLVGYRLRTALSLTDQLNGGVYDQLIIDLVLERPLGYYLWEVILQVNFYMYINIIYTMTTFRHRHNAA